MESVMKASAKPGRPPSPTSKRALKQDRHVHPRRSFHAPQALWDALAAYIEQAKPRPSESAVLRLALERFLEGAKS